MTRAVCAWLAVGAAISFVPWSAAAPPPAPPPAPRGLLVLDNCDREFRGKDRYENNLSLIDDSGRVVFRAGGFNGCEMIGSTHMVAVDARRGWAWACELVANKVHQYDRSGRRLTTIENLRADALAVDPESGNLWVLGGRQIGSGTTEVYNPAGRLLVSHPVSGLDLAYSPMDKSFWIADRHLARIRADEVAAPVRPADAIVAHNVAGWTVSSIDVHPVTGRIWVTPRQHPQVLPSENRLVCLDSTGRVISDTDLKALNPFRVSVDPKDGSVWVAIFRQAVHRYSPDGKLEAAFDINATSVEADPDTGGAWAVTEKEILLLNRAGQIKQRVPHKGPSSQSWIARW
jgi:hypothetical protein